MENSVTALLTLCPQNTSNQVHVLNSLEGINGTKYCGILLNNGDLMLEASHRVYHSVTAAIGRWQ